jgi:hypothetical protein
MSFESILQHPFRLLLAIALVASMAAAPTLAMAQEEEPDQATHEIQRRNFASVEQMEAAQDMSMEQRCEADQWVVMAGESLGFIASVCGIPFDVLLAHNHQISQPDLVYPGELVNIPADPFAEEQPFLTQAQLEYIQQTFETPVIPETGEPVADVIERRNIASADRIEAAQAMSLEQRCEADQWVVLSGESLGFIASVCGIPFDVLLAHNHQISQPDLVFQGEMVNIPADPFAEEQPFLTQAQLEYIQQTFETPVIPETGEPVADVIERRNIAGADRIEEAQAMSLEQRCEAGQWVVLSGESLGFITSVCGIPLDVLLAHNHQISTPDLVFVGELVNIPADPFAEVQPLLTQAQIDYLRANFAVPELDEAEEPVDDEDVEDEEEEEEDEDDDE